MKRTVVCIVGSSKFKDTIRGLEQRETLRGKITLQHGFYHHQDLVPITDRQKADLDELMIAKVELADEILVCNINGYIGQSTLDAIAYAEKNNKPVKYEYGKNGDRPSSPGVDP